MKIILHVAFDSFIFSAIFILDMYIYLPKTAKIVKWMQYDEYVEE